MSDNNPWNDPVSESPTPVKKKGMSGCMLASIIVGSLGLVCMLVCCAGAIWLGSMVIPKETKAPAEIAAIGHEVLNTDVLPDFSPDKALTWDNMLFTLKITQFTHKENKGEILMGALKVKFGDLNQAKMQSQQLRGPLEEKSRGPLDIKKSESKEIMINGQKISVSIGEATDRMTGKSVHTASADFEQAGGMFTFFFLRMDDDVWNEDAVLKMLEDVKAP